MKQGRPREYKENTLNTFLVVSPVKGSLKPRRIKIQYPVQGSKGRVAFGWTDTHLVALTIECICTRYADIFGDDLDVMCYL